MFYLQYGRFVFLLLFAAISVIHLFVAKKRNLTKSLILPLLMLYYVTSVRDVSWFLTAALFFSWLGDVLLEKDGLKWFVSGGISFLVSHLFFITVYLLDTDTANIRLLPVIISAVLFITASAAIIKIIKPYTPDKMTIPLFLYLFINGCMNIFAMVRLSSVLTAGAAMTAVGALLFYVSDSVLFIGQFYEKKKYRTFYLCMATYIAGEFLITQGLLLR